MVLKCEATGYRIPYFLKDKTQVHECLEVALNRVKRETGSSVKYLRTDNGTEYVNEKVRNLLIQHGIEHERSPPDVKQANGMAERENRTLMDGARTLLYDATMEEGLLKRLWIEAVATAAYLRNRVPNRGNTKVTPYEQWFKQRPDVAHLRIFGSPAFTRIPDHFRRKLDPKAKKQIFVGYDWKTTKIYRVYDPLDRKVHRVGDTIVCEQTQHDSQTQKESVSPATSRDFRHVELLSFPQLHDESSSDTGSPSIVVTPPIDDSPHETQEVLADPKMDENQEHERMSRKRPHEGLLFDTNTPDRPPPRKRGRPKASKTGAKWKVLNTENPSDRELRTRGEQKATLIAERSSAHDPKSYTEAMQREEASEWKTAMDDEMASLTQHETWTLVHLPKDKQAITGRWVLKTKIHEDGTIHKYKARFVARGYAQVEGVDFFETYAPVVRADTIRTLLATANAKDWTMQQFDVKTAFLYGPLEEEVYMEQPEGYHDGSDRVCRLHKGLYGLKQSPRQWNGLFHQFLMEEGFEQCPDDPCLYKTTVQGTAMFLCLYVDDGLVVAEQEYVILDFLQRLKNKFDVTSQPPDMYVGIRIQRNRAQRIMSLHQSGYISRVLTRFGMLDATTTTSPADPAHKLTKDMKAEAGQATNFPYREAIGCLNYLAVMTRPDIAFAVNKAAKFCEDPQPAHWQAVKRILRYLKLTMHIGIIYSGKDTSIATYCDSDYAGDLDTRRSTSGTVSLMNGGPITWNSSTQTVTALASTEAEYMAMSVAMKDILWLRRLWSFIHGTQPSKPTPLYVDNQGAIALSKNPDFRRRSKHIETKYHRLREEQEEGRLQAIFIPTSEQVADVFTKELNGPGMVKARQQLGMTAHVREEVLKG
jgi:hypothetical protein